MICCLFFKTIIFYCLLYFNFEFFELFTVPYILYPLKWRIHQTEYMSLIIRKKRFKAETRQMSDNPKLSKNEEERSFNLGADKQVTVRESQGQEYIMYIVQYNYPVPPSREISFPLPPCFHFSPVAIYFPY